MSDRASAPEPAVPASPDDFLQRLGERVRTMRSRRGMSRKALAKHSDVSERYLAQLEGGTGNCSIVLLRRIAGAMSVPLAELVGERPEPAIDTQLLMQLLERLSPLQIAEARELLLARFGGSSSDLRRGRIALIGLRGGGKSTLGRLLGDELRVPFVELDRVIEQQSGMALSELFEMFGQATFRRMERAALETILRQHPSFVLATGGSLVAESSTFELLLTSCLTVWIRARPDEHMNRVIAQGDLRPMAGNTRSMQDLIQILQSREPLYAKADITLDTTNRTPPQAVAELRRALAPLQQAGATHYAVAR
jgi:XRE family aerobic/anaerobic benzoate catabolism transcriptional regulator